MMKDYLDKGTQSFSRFMFVFLCVCGLILSTTTALWANESESQTGSAGTTRAWSDLAPEPGAGASALEEEHPLLYDIPKEELEWLKRQPYTCSSPQDMITLEEDGCVFGLAPVAKAAVVTSFEGMDVDDQPAGISRPPDPHAAAGPSHIVTVVNTSLAVYDKTGTQLKSGSFASWWANVYATSNPFDPRIVYDHNEGHWIMMALALSGSTTSKILISVSKTNDPTGDWWNWALEGALTVDSSNTWADYPDVGFDDISSGSGGAIYITANQFTFSANAFKTSVLLILPKSSLYTGGTLSYWRAWDRTDGDGGQAFTLRTAVTFDTPGAEYMVNTAGSGVVTLWKVVPTFPPTAVNWTRQASISIGSYSSPPDAKQLGCANTLDTISTRMYNCVYRDGYVYGAFCEGYDWGSGTVAAIRYLKLNTSTNAATLNIRYGADGYYYWMPAICPDGSNNIALVFARSSTGEYAGLRTANRESGASSTSRSSLIKAGVECITGFRWGDYFSAALDPSESGRVWVYGQYAKNVAGVSSTWDWGTRVASITFSGGGLTKRDLVGDWSGTWAFMNNSTWKRITTGSPGTGKMVTGDLDGNGQDDLIGDWPPNGTWAYMNDTNWKRITTDSPGVGGMTTGDLDGNGKDDLIGDWPPNGTWAYMNDTNWKRITKDSPGVGMVTGDLDGSGEADLIGYWPPNGTWAYMNDTNWKRITTDSPGVGMVTGDLDGNGLADVIGGWNGTWAYMNNSTWEEITSASPGAVRMVTGDLDGSGKDDLIGDWNGTWCYYNNSSWTRLTPASPGTGGWVTGDLDANGLDDLIGDWSGTWCYYNNSTWIRLTPASPGTGGMVTGDLDGN